MSAKDEKKVVPTLSRVLKSIVQGGNVYSERKLNNAKCIVQIIKDISLVKVSDFHLSSSIKHLIKGCFAQCRL